MTAQIRGARRGVMCFKFMGLTWARILFSQALDQALVDALGVGLAL